MGSKSTCALPKRSRHLPSVPTRANRSPEPPPRLRPAAPSATSTTSLPRPGFGGREMSFFRALLWIITGLAMGYLAKGQSNGQVPINFGYYDTTANLQSAVPGTPPKGSYAFTGDNQLVYFNGTSWTAVYPRLTTVTTS